MGARFEQEREGVAIRGEAKLEHFDVEAKGEVGAVASGESADHGVVGEEVGGGE